MTAFGWVVNSTIKTVSPTQSSLGPNRSPTSSSSVGDFSVRELESGCSVDASLQYCFVYQVQSYLENNCNLVFSNNKIHRARSTVDLYQGALDCGGLSAGAVVQAFKACSSLPVGSGRKLFPYELSAFAGRLQLYYTELHGIAGKTHPFSEANALQSAKKNIFESCDPVQRTPPSRPAEDQRTQGTWVPSGVPGTSPQKLFCFVFFVAGLTDFSWHEYNVLLTSCTLRSSSIPRLGLGNISETLNQAAGGNSELRLLVLVVPG